MAYLPKSRNCVNTRQTAIQKNALFFLSLRKITSFFLLPLPDCHHFLLFGGFHSVFSVASLCRLFLISLCSNDIFVSLTACCHGSRPCLFSFRFLLSGLRCRQITAALSSLYERTVRPSRPMIFSCIRSSLADRKYRPARSVSMRMQPMPRVAFGCLPALTLHPLS